MRSDRAEMLANEELFVDAMKEISTDENWLGNYFVVENLVKSVISDFLDIMRMDIDKREKEFSTKCSEIEDILLGKNDDFSAKTNWNCKGRIDEVIAKQMNTDPDNAIKKSLDDLYSKVYAIADNADKAGWKYSISDLIGEYVLLYLGV